jgi:hypothetical protein
LDKWIDYLSSPDATYPDWAKYWAFRSMTEMGKLEKKEDPEGKETARFQKRTRDTVASFPTLNPRALALTIGVLRSRLEEKVKPKEERAVVENKSLKLDDQEFQDLLSTENFSRIYTQFLIEMPEYSAEGLQATAGEWMKYPKGSDATPLVASLEGHPLEWCTADLGTAQSQLEGGDFYVYYSMNEAGEATIPRVAIRMQENAIAEVRGIASNQNLDPYIGGVVQEKLNEFPDGAAYEKKAQGMKQLTVIEKKTQKSEALTRDDLTFLYEINAPIEGFGYENDPRIKELRDQRNPDEDILVILDCTKGEIAHNANEITDTTKAYVGALCPEIFKTNVEHIYRTFPEGKIKRYEIEIGDKTKDEYVHELIKKNIKFSDYASELLESPDFGTLPSGERVALVCLTVDNLGFPSDATTDEIYQKAQEWGLELCPPEVGPALRLAVNSPGEMNIAMKQIEGGEASSVFRFIQSEGALWLSAADAWPGKHWYVFDKFVFRARKVDELAANKEKEINS